jgi:hypothetical protein
MLPDTPYDRALYLQNMLLSHATNGSGDDKEYRQLRTELLANEATKPFVPDFVRQCRDLNAFWSVAKQMSPSWEPRRVQIRAGFGALLDLLESGAHSPADRPISSTLESFDVEGVHKVWEKALARRKTDPDGAITAARTLLETVCKRILDEEEVAYAETDDLPKLYRQAAQSLSLAPDQHSEDAFRRILGGCTSVVEGLGTLRNKIGDAHGKGGKPVRPAARHAHLAVNLAGAMATFLLETWMTKHGRS